MNFSRKKLLIIGHIARDIVETKYGNGSFWGGAGYHTALAASSFLPKKSVVLLSMVGNDFDFSVLRKLGVNTDYILIDSQNKTDVHKLNEKEEVRTYFSEGELCQKININNLEKIKNEIGWIHLASSPPQQQLKWMEEIKLSGLGELPISCDTFDTFVQKTPDLVKKVMKNCDLAFMNRDEWTAIEGGKMKMEIVLKLGDRGAEYFINGNKKVKISDISEVIAKDTTGAGDVVAGVFLGLRLRGFSIGESLTEACKVATMSVMGFGTEHLVERMGFSDDFMVKTNRN